MQGVVIMRIHDPLRFLLFIIVLGIIAKMCGYWFLVLCKYEYIITHRSNELEDLTFTGGVDPITGDESDTGAIAIHHYNLV